MTEYTPNALAMVTECFSADAIETTARRRGCVKRAAQSTGTRLLALSPFGVWSDATTTRAQWAAKVTALVDPLAVSPAAMYPRMHNHACTNARMPFCRR